MKKPVGTIGRRLVLTAVAFAMIFNLNCMGDNKDPAAALAMLGDEAGALASILGLRTGIAFADKDKDLINDYLENDLMRRYAPILHMHPRETSMPASVPWVLEGSQMKHDSDNMCSDNLILDWGQITPYNMGRQSTSGKGGLFCSTTGGRYYSNRTYPDGKRFYLKIGERKYPGNLAQAKCYARVGLNIKQDVVELPGRGRRTINYAEAKYVIEYYWFYAYNPAVPFQVTPAGLFAGVALTRTFAPLTDNSAARVIGATSQFRLLPFAPPGWLTFLIAAAVGEGGNHQGDWENVRVYVKENGEVLAVDYVNHGSPAPYKAGGRELTLLNGKRPKVYAAIKSHASYPQAGVQYKSAGILGAKAVIHSDYTQAGGKVLDCAQYGRLINVGNAKYPSPGNEWIHYRNAWGHKKTTWSPLADSGPIGPAMKGIDWNSYAGISGTSSLTFQAHEFAPKTQSYSFHFSSNSLTRKLPDTARITSVGIIDNSDLSVNNSPYAALTRSGNHFRVTIRPRNDVYSARYTIRVIYSLPVIGAGGRTTSFTQFKSISVRHLGYKPSNCNGGPTLHQPLSRDCPR